MANRETLAKTLIAVENMLNSNVFCDFRIGALLAKYNEHLYRGRIRNKRWLWVIAGFLKFFIQGLFVKRPSNQLFNDKTILLSKLADKNQCNRLIDPLKHAFRAESVLYTPGVKNELIPVDFTRRVNIMFFIKLIFWLVLNVNKISVVYKSKNIRVSSTGLSFHLMVQLVAAYNWLHVLNGSQLKLIVVDFDRDSKSSALITAAKLLKIKTITLVHGVINPPFGYYPVVADEIWLWSNYQKKQLEHMAGKAILNYKIVGNPIVELFNRNKAESTDLRVGIAVNPMGADVNRQFLANVFASSKDLKAIRWRIKLHPSMDKRSFLKEFGHPQVEVSDSREISNEVFFNSIDLLIVGNSGLGFEAVANDVPIAVIRHSNREEGHDFVMVRDFACPDVTDLVDFVSFFRNVLENRSVLSDVLEKEKGTILSYYFHAIDVAAVENIIKAIKDELAG